MKKYIIFILLVISLIFLIRINTISNKCKDINYCAERYVTSTLNYKYRLSKIDTLSEVFSDGQITVMIVSGIQNIAPHKTVTYKLFLEKNGNGQWRVQKFYN